MTVGNRARESTNLSFFHSERRSMISYVEKYVAEYSTKKVIEEGPPRTGPATRVVKLARTRRIRRRESMFYLKSAYTNTTPG